MTDLLVARKVDRLAAMLLNVGLYIVVRYRVKVINSQSVANTISPTTHRSYERTNLMMIVAETATAIESFITDATSRRMSTDMYINNGRHLLVY